MKKEILIISAINIFEGGALSVLKDCLSELNNKEYIRFTIIVLVHKKNLFLKGEFINIKFIEINDSRGSYIKRLYYEYFYFNNISRKFKPKFWFSFHDVTPILTNTIQFVYCHNPSPFNHFNLKDIFLQPKQLIFNIFYKYVYGFNINKNKYVIVQQKWIKNKFIHNYNINPEKIIISKPFINKPEVIKVKSNTNNDIKFFIFPAFPRPFKNIEIICKCANQLINEGYINFKIILTFDGTENVYSKYIFNKYKNNPNLIFTGSLPRSTIFEFYSKVDCMIFPSKLETWGMPLSEFIQYNKPILVSNLPYAKETIGSYDYVKYFNPDSTKELIFCIKNILNGSISFDKTSIINYPEPYAENWKQLFNLILFK